jgi:hypothetical protein
MSGITWLILVLVVFGVLAYRRSSAAGLDGRRRLLLLGIQLTSGGCRRCRGWCSRSSPGC